MFSLVAVSAELAEQLVAIESDGEDAVHQARIRVRRLRSVLQVYRAAFDRDAEVRLRSRLKSLGDRLGAVRDLEVKADALEDLLEADDEIAVVDVVSAEVAETRAAHERELASLIQHLRGRTVRVLLADLQMFAAEPPLSAKGRSGSDRVRSRGLQKAIRKVHLPRGDSLEDRHETRKAARKVRYAAEAVADELGRPAVRLAAAAKAAQDALGDNRDDLLLAHQLREHGHIGLARRCERRAAEALDGLDEKLAAIEL
ncbi:CHAD domain-containing protein [Leifsonia sp. TF02-11]|uniref:CHAD domain-containing protein n=1 Tax=Leifsonia sp. TF02-11 TaxID=2815212 RepID=UPI001AA11B63|nr:CHAD domain-containing protein [Leifsonia sp. TF02-11]MBO1740514.1 CHAD domain-containing protein [Leifsonia sp. TF02-11]